MEAAALRCCCGSPNCAFLAHSGKLLERVERDVDQAARMGQALLIRHEAYVADSERERQRMTASIEALEREKLELEQRNAETIQANRALLDQLERLNSAVASSDVQIQSLTDALHQSEEEIARLSILAARTQSLEQQLIDLEREQAALEGKLESKIGDERTALQRWRRAEKTIGDLQDQIDRIEAEASEERERHMEIIARMERRMAVEGELATAAGRLKAKAGHEKEEKSNSVVSHFVKDILLDNANLQSGILELREMLQSSNEEVERLREQLQIHQPLTSPISEPGEAPPSLDKELEQEPVAHPQVHIHHHYHPPKLKKEGVKVQVQRRPRKKRYSGNPGRFNPMVPASPSSTAAILSQTSVTVPPNTQRWSNATTLAPSSAPGSPFSMSVRDSIYDRVFSDVAYDSSRPTSPPDSVHLASPNMKPAADNDAERPRNSSAPHRRSKSQSLKPPSLFTIRSTSSPISLVTKASPATAVLSSSPADSLSNDIFLLSPSIDSAIMEENEDATTPDRDSLHPPASTSGLSIEFDDALASLPQHGPTLRRALSHESLISVSGMDIHTLQSRPAQLLFNKSPLLTSPSPGTSPQPVVTPWTATAHGSLSRHQTDISTFNRSLLHASTKRAPRPSPKARKPSALGKKVGGWVFGKWGTAPEPSPSPTQNLRHSRSSDECGKTAQAQAQEQAIEGSKDSPSAATPTPPRPPLAAKSKTSSTSALIKFRSPGINQSGPIWGIFDIPPTPAQVEVTHLDAEALDEALAEAAADREATSQATSQVIPEVTPEAENVAA